MPSLLEVLRTVSYLLELVDLLEVPHPRADDAAHAEEDAPGGNAEGDSDDEHVVVETTTDNILEGDEILPKEFAVETCKHAIIRICQVADARKSCVKCS